MTDPTALDLADIVETITEILDKHQQAMRLLGDAVANLTTALRIQQDLNDELNIRLDGPCHADVLLEVANA